MAKSSDQSSNEATQSLVERVRKGLLPDLLIQLLITVAIGAGGVLLAWYFDNFLLALLITVLLLLALNVVLLLRILRNQNRSLPSQQASIQTFIIQDENKNFYLHDNFGRVRPIPNDDDTITYLQDLVHRTIEIESNDIVPVLGQSIISLRNWRAPLTPQEAQRIELNQHIKLKNVRFVENVTPQKFALTLRNETAEKIQILGIQVWNISQMFNDAYENVNGKCKIPFDISMSLLDPGQSVEFYIELISIWERDQIYSSNINWGSLYVEILYHDKRYELSYVLK